MDHLQNVIGYFDQQQPLCAEHDRIAADPAFGLTREEIVAGLVPENFVGRAPQQVEEFVANVLKPIFDANPDAVEQHASLSV